MNVITAPEDINVPGHHFKVFLAGTIDSGNSEDWQREVINRLKEKNILLLTIFNPRRETWSNETNAITQQIEWELNRLEESNLIIMNILPDSKSPISLLEMGLFADSHRLRVFCTPEFYRFENVSVTSEFYDINLNYSNSVDNIVDCIIDEYNKRMKINKI